MSNDDILLSKLFDSYTYLDSSACGVQEQKMFTNFTAIIVKCDRCGNYYAADCGFEHQFRDEQDATEAVIYGGWAEIDGKLYCPSCYEYDEDTNEYEVRK